MILSQLLSLVACNDLPLQHQPSTRGGEWKARCHRTHHSALSMDWIFDSRTCLMGPTNFHVTTFLSNLLYLSRYFRKDLQEFYIDGCWSQLYVDLHANKHRRGRNETRRRQRPVSISTFVVPFQCCRHHNIVFFIATFSRISGDSSPLCHKKRTHYRTTRSANRSITTTATTPLGWGQSEVRVRPKS